VIDETWNSGESIDLVRVTRKSIQYLYAAGDEFHFMDNETYDQFAVPRELISDYVPYLIENMTMESLIREDDESIIDIAFPPTVVLEVTEAYDAARGDSAGPVMKPAKVETGYELLVPPFIRQGERIRIDTAPASTWNVPESHLPSSIRRSHPMMTRSLALLVLVALSFTGAAHAKEAPLIPMKDFFRNPEKVYFQLSPNGAYLAFLQPWQSRLNVHVQKIGTEQATRVTEATARDVQGYAWKGNERIIYILDKGGDENFRLYAVNIDGSNPQTSRHSRRSASRSSTSSRTTRPRC